MKTVWLSDIITNCYKRGDEILTFLSVHNRNIVA